VSHAVQGAWIWRLATYSLLLAALARIGLAAYLEPTFVDYTCFVDATQAILRGQDPFALENLRHARWNVAPLVYPGLTLFFLPFALIDLNPGKYLYTLFNAAAGLAYYFVLVRRSGLCARFSLRAPDRRTAAASLGACLYVNSIFFVQSLHVGQVAMFGAMLMAFSLPSTQPFLRTMALAASAALKYSNVPLWALLYAVKGRFRFCVASFLLFLAISALPAIFGHDLIGLYGAYLKNLRAWTSPGGGNTFAVSGYTMLTLDFLESDALTLIGKGALLLAFVWILWRERQRRMGDYDLHVLFFASCLTLGLAYHRTYDGALAYPFLLLEAACLFRARDWPHAAIAGTFIAVFSLPGRVFIAIATQLGAAIGQNGFVVIPDGIFPLSAVLMFLVTVFALYLCVIKERVGSIDVDFAPVPDK
jgi:hypothetical protein